jgi:hypothetical protein
MCCDRILRTRALGCGSDNRALRRAERHAIDAVLIGLGSSKTRQLARAHTSVLRAPGRAATLAHLPKTAANLPILHQATPPAHDFRWPLACGRSVPSDGNAMNWSTCWTRRQSERRGERLRRWLRAGGGLAKRQLPGSEADTWRVAPEGAPFGIPVSAIALAGIDTQMER